MQKVVTFRASQSDLDRSLNNFTKRGWRVISISKGSELGRVGFSYKWIVVLEIPDNDPNAKYAENMISQTKSYLSTGSYVKTVLLAVGVCVGIFAFIGIMLLILL